LPRSQPLRLRTQVDRVFARPIEDFRIVHLSLQRDHVHLLVEAKNTQVLSAGMQGFQISAAKHLNAAISKRRPGPRRRGRVFSDRYHAEIITSPRQARHALSYVLSNWRKHREDRVAPMSSWTIDWFSSAVMFPGWAEYGDEPFLWRRPADLRSAGRAAAQNLVAKNGLSAGRTTDLVPRGTIGRAGSIDLTCTAHVGDGLAHAPYSTISGPRPDRRSGARFASGSIARRVHGLTILTEASTSARPRGDLARPNRRFRVDVAGQARPERATGGGQQHCGE
jgi:REP element-mobilizing transposase RayT